MNEIEELKRQIADVAQAGLIVFEEISAEYMRNERVVDWGVLNEAMCKLEQAKREYAPSDK